MSIIRTKRKKHNFTVIDNTGLIDSTLTWKETGLLAFLMTKPDDWSISIKALSNNKLDGRDSVAAALKGLQEKGYVYRVDSRERGRFQTEYLVFETKEDLQEWLQDNDFHRDGFSVTAKPERLNRNGLTVTANPSQLNTDIDITDQPNTEKLNTKITPPTPSPKISLEKSGSVPDTPQSESALEQTCKLKPDGSEWFPWELIDPVKGWVVEEEFLKYIAEVVKDYTGFKDLPIKRFAREVFNFINKAHSDAQRKVKLLGYWEDYRTPNTGNELTISQAFDQSKQKAELERIRNASKRKFEL